MSTTESLAAPHPRTALARSIGLAAFVYGYPLLEMLRTCRLQTLAADAAAPTAGRPGAPIDQPLHWAGPTQAGDRDVVTPANDLMYTTAWIHLADGPRVLQVPAAADHPGRYFVLALYDAFTENFCNLGPRNCRAEGESVWLAGPDDAGPFPAGQRVVRAPTNLVWLLARVLVTDADDLPSAKALQATIGITPANGSATATPPAAVALWQGEPVDPVAAVLEHGEPPEAVAERFYANLCRALAEAPGRPEDQGLLAWLGAAELRPGPGFDWPRLDPVLQAGLLQGFGDGVALLAASAQHRQPRPWVLSTRNGRYGSAYLGRAIVAYIGLGALAVDEALYAVGHFDAALQPLDGHHRYTLRFEPGERPPAEAFWSVTLYAADRYLYPNTLACHAIGDRTRGLRTDPGGGLTIQISHAAPDDTGNWLPAPPGRFYLVLRLYHPSETVRGWHIPPLQRSDA